MQLSNQVYALSNASSFGVSYTVMGGKKATTPIVYTLECNQGKIIINYHSTERIKNDATGLTESKHSMLQVAEIKAIPGSLYVNFNRDLLPNKLCFDNYSFHWELLCNYALPDWIYRATDLVESNKIAPVWLIVSKLIELTCYDDLTNELTINETNLVKPFVELDWWKVLLQCSKECAGIVQFANAVKMIPDQFKPKLGLATSRDINVLDEIKFKLLTIDAKNELATKLGCEPIHLTDHFNNEEELIALCQLHGIATKPPVTPDPVK